MDWWKTIASVESYGIYGKISLRLTGLVKEGEILSDDLTSHIQRMLDKIHEAFVTERSRPEMEQRAKDDASRILALFEEGTRYEEIPNGYMPDGSYGQHPPWYRVMSPIGPIIIGWRRRVINIDWSGTVVKKKADDLFHEIENTKHDHTIHAYGYEEAGRVIKILLAQ